MRWLALLASAVLVVACAGDTPISPSPSPTTPSPPTPETPPPSLTGFWIGEMALTIGAQKGTLRTRVELAQNGTNVTGTWVVTIPRDNDVRGTIKGTVDGWTIGPMTVTWDSASLEDDVRCVGQTTFTAQWDPDFTMTWHADAFVLDTCSDPPTNIRWRLRR